jgi:glucose/arabinose dehydrogenase
MLASTCCFFLLAPLLQEPSPTSLEAEAYAVDYLTPPQGEVLEVGGMDFLSDGTLLVSTRRGRVWWIENALAEDPAEARFHIYAEGLHEGLGLKVVNDEIFVMQRGELSKLIDLDGDKLCDRIETVSQAWGMSGNYHEFAFGLPQDQEGNFYISTNVGFWNPEWWHGQSRAPFRGWVLKIAPDGTMTPLASGVRSPAGLGLDSQDRLFYTDNQGDWMPVCGLFEVEDGAFFGHPASLRWTEAYGNGSEVPSMTEPPARDRDDAAIWIPYEWSRSTGNVISDQTGGRFGPFQDQLFLAELTNGMVLRAMLEDVEGVTQGAVLPFRQQVGSAFRVAFAPDGTMFAGFTNRGWGGLPPGEGLSRIRWTGRMPLEYQDIKLQEDGFQLRFTAPLEQVPSPEQFQVYRYDYNSWWDYGSPMMHQEDLVVKAVVMDADGQGLRLQIEGLEPGYCVRVALRDAGLMHESFDYTVRQLPGRKEAPVVVAKKVAPPEVQASNDEGWLTLTWSDPFDAWISNGWELVSAELDPEDSSQFVIRPGNSALVNVGPDTSGFRSRMSFGDIAFRFSFMLPEGGDSGMYFMDRYELQLVDDPSQCGGIVGVKGPRAKGYRGAGTWHIATGRFYAPRFDAEGNKIANARFEEVAIDGVMVLGAAECSGPTGGAGLPGEAATGPLRFQGTAGLVAMGDIRIKQLHDGEAVAVEGESLTAAELPAAGVVGNFELHARMSLSDGGGAAIDFHIPPQGGAAKYRLLLNHNAPGDARTGSLEGHSVISTQLLNGGVPFDLRLRCTTDSLGTHITVWLNGIVVNDYLDQQGSDEPGLLGILPELVSGTELKIESLVLQRL